MGAGKSIHKIDEGFYICGVDALRDHAYLNKLGIKAILNAAQLNLYQMSAMGKGEDSLEDLEKKFDVKIIGADDVEDCNLSVHFQEIADFIEAGRKKGGVVVHCAAGVSRASTSCMAYLMIKEHLTLQAAHRKVHAVRKIIHPNSGFWRQLNDLQASLIAKGVSLRELPADYRPPEQPLRPGEEGKEKFSSTADESAESKKLLDNEAKHVQPFVTHFLTARISPKPDVKGASIKKELEKLAASGVKLESCSNDGEVVVLRAGLVPTLTHEVFASMVQSIPGVARADCE
mmetsp:Transcript_38846/g.89873  ORF Transcript_38846/g.89873 Transcript_38846/m.89873 type:complete len:288 (+) Transcript_38846:46-909(+)